MSRSQLEYVDLRDPSTRQSYSDDAPTPLEGTPLPDVSSDVSLTLPPPPPRRTRPPRRPVTQPRSDKRPYVKTTLTLKLGLKAAFEKNGDELTDAQYSSQFGIPLKNTQGLLTELRNGESVLLNGRSGRRKVMCQVQNGFMVPPRVEERRLRNQLFSLSASSEGPNNEVLPKAIETNKLKSTCFVVFDCQTERTRISNMTSMNRFCRRGERQRKPEKQKQACSILFRGRNPEWG